VRAEISRSKPKGKGGDNLPFFFMMSLNELQTEHLPAKPKRCLISNNCHWRPRIYAEIDRYRTCGLPAQQVVAFGCKADIEND
jgi:hypothetical protein